MIEIIPAIDIIDSQCVRLSRGDYHTKKVYDSNPAAIAKKYEEIGIRRLHVVDLDGAKSSRIQNGDTLAAICRETDLTVDFGGGIKNDASAQEAFDRGASYITAGSIAVKEPETVSRWLKIYGADKIILGADFRDGKISVSGWQKDSKEDLWAFMDAYAEKGIKTIISTDISTDGMLSGPSADIYRQMRARYADLYLIASGGVASMEDIHMLDDLGMDAVIVGKAIYENRITFDDLKEYCQTC